MDETRTQPTTATKVPERSRTEVEAWLLELGLRAIQVEACPVDDCPACGSGRRRAA
jgi:hypothetical protein